LGARNVNEPHTTTIQDDADLGPDAPGEHGAAAADAEPTGTGSESTKDARGGGTVAMRHNRTFSERVEAWLSRLSTKNNFLHRIFSLIWLPFAFRSGIKMKRVDAKTFTAILPFKRFNRNWYNAMAGAALLGNSEIAGGMYVFGECGGDYTVVCKNLEYKFLRPCFGPAIYRIMPREDLKSLAGAGQEFNITVDMDVMQQIIKPGDRERRVGRCTAIFHVTPKTHHKKERQKAREERARRASEG
jgi:hypothetical protein